MTAAVALPAGLAAAAVFLAGGRGRRRGRAGSAAAPAAAAGPAAGPTAAAGPTFGSAAGPARPRAGTRAGTGAGAGAAPRVPWALFLIAGALVLAFPGPAGLLAATATLGAARTAAARLAGSAVRRRRELMQRDAPLGLELLALALEAGLGPGPAAAVAGAAVGGPVGEELAAVVRALRLGLPAERAWSLLCAAGPPLEVLALTVPRAEHTGAPLAAELTRLAGEARATATARCLAAARSTGVRAAVPLGLCYLPAFVALGIVPVIVGVVSGLLR
ncbi:MAG: type II secretion system F family protein [Mycobacteriales bacterium]